MDYAAMSARDLQQECRRRGLPTARSKAVMIERLTDADAAQTGPSPAEQPAPGAPGQPEAAAVEGADTAPAVAAPAAPDEPARSNVFHRTFPAGPQGPDDAEHYANRQATLQGARDAGYAPRGDAYRTGTVNGHEVYEVRVREAT